MRYQVPQFVDIEDKVIGPLTVKQFIIYIVAAMVLVPFYLALELAFFLAVAIPIIAVFALFAHFKPGGKSLFATVGSALTFLSRGQIFVWRRTSKPKLLAVQGDEYRDVGISLGLSGQARNLNAGGSIINEDLEDPYAEE